jgi:hypothetical protein
VKRDLRARRGRKARNASIVDAAEDHALVVRCRRAIDVDGARHAVAASDGETDVLEHVVRCGRTAEVDVDDGAIVIAERQSLDTAREAERHRCRDFVHVLHCKVSLDSVSLRVPS